MTEVISRSERVRRAARTAPYLIPLYMRKFNPSLTKWTLYDMLPFRTSIEIECFGSLQWGYILKNDAILPFDTLLNEFKLVDYDEDYGYDRAFEYDIKREIEQKKMSLHSIRKIARMYPIDVLQKIIPIIANKYNYMFQRETGIEAIHSTLNDCLGYGWESSFNANYLVYNEHRISIPNYTGLYGLYKVLELMKEHCIPNPASGIHIHVDFSKLSHLNPAYNANDYLFVKKIIDPLLDEVGHIFREDLTRLTDKEYGNWIKFNIPNDTLTLEFRLGDMTFDYETIVGWMIKCNSFTKKLYGLLGVDYKTGKRLDLKPNEVKKELECEEIPHGNRRRRQYSFASA